MKKRNTKKRKNVVDLSQLPNKKEKIPNSSSLVPCLLPQFVGLSVGLSLTLIRTCVHKFTKRFEPYYEGFGGWFWRVVLVGLSVGRELFLGLGVFKLLYSAQMLR